MRESESGDDRGLTKRPALFGSHRRTVNSRCAKGPIREAGTISACPSLPYRTLRTSSTDTDAIANEHNGRLALRMTHAIISAGPAGSEVSSNQRIPAVAIGVSVRLTRDLGFERRACELVGNACRVLQISHNRLRHGYGYVFGR
jgi:hypothetical protein